MSKSAVHSINEDIDNINVDAGVVENKLTGNIKNTYWDEEKNNMIKLEVDLVEDLFSYELLMTYNKFKVGKKLSCCDALQMRRDLIMMVVAQTVIFSSVISYISKVKISY